MRPLWLQLLRERGRHSSQTVYCRAPAAAGKGQMNTIDGHTSQGQCSLAWAILNAGAVGPPGMRGLFSDAVMKYSHGLPLRAPDHCGGCPSIGQTFLSPAGEHPTRSKVRSKGAANLRVSRNRWGIYCSGPRPVLTVLLSSFNPAALIKERHRQQNRPQYDESHDAVAALQRRDVVEENLRCREREKYDCLPAQEG